MTIFLLIGIILAFGGSAALTAFMADSLPLKFYTDAAEFSFIGTMLVYAAAILLVFVIIAAIAGISRTKKKPVADNTSKVIDKLGKIEGLIKEGSYEIASVSGSVGKVMSKLSEDKIDPNSELNSILVRMEEYNETVPLLKRLLGDSEEQKGKLIAEQSKLRNHITELEVENEQLEKNNLSLQRVIDNALEPYRDKSDKDAN